MNALALFGWICARAWSLRMWRVRREMKMRRRAGSHPATT